MAQVLSKQAMDYLERLTNQESSESESLYYTVLKLRQTNEAAFVHCAHLIFSYQCPVNVAFLAFDLVNRQLEAGRNANPQRIFQSLSKNKRSSYDDVKPLYDVAIEFLNKFVADKEKQEQENNSNVPEILKQMQKNDTTVSNEDIEEYSDDEYEDDEDDDDDCQEYEYENADRINTLHDNTKSDFVFKPVVEDSQFLNEYLLEHNFKSNEKNQYVVNSCIIPKHSWVVNVFAKDYQDYCSIVQSTLKELNDAGITVFLAKPEIFQNKKDAEPKIAYTILTGEKFNFSSLSEQFITSLDSGEDLKFNSGIKIANRANIDFITFAGDYFSDVDGKVSADNKSFLSSFAKEEDMLSAIEGVGSATDIIKHYIEVKTGIDQTQNEQLYHPILFRSTDILHIASILREIETGKLDFVVDSDRDEIKILFVHISHSNELFKILSSRNIPVDTHPTFS